MKRLFAAILCLCLLAGCGRTDSTGNTCRAEEGSGGGDVSGKTEEPGADAGGELFRVIRSQAGAAPLLLAKESGGPGDVYTLSPTTVEPDAGWPFHSGHGSGLYTGNAAGNHLRLRAGNLSRPAGGGHGGEYPV